jgi:cytochrome P450
MASVTGQDMSRTIIHELQESKLSPEDRSPARVNEEVASVTGAGFETVASILRIILFHAYTNPAILQRIRAELADAGVSSNSGEASAPLKTLENLPYLTAMLMEGMRLSPGFGTRLARISDQDLVYQQYMIPAGTPVGMSSILMHMDESVYADPASFNPERWLNKDDRRKLEKSWAPFSRGTRHCLGM